MTDRHSLWAELPHWTRPSTWFTSMVVRVEERKLKRRAYNTEYVRRRRAIMKSDPVRYRKYLDQRNVKRKEKKEELARWHKQHRRYYPYHQDNE